MTRLLFIIGILFYTYSVSFGQDNSLYQNRPINKVDAKGEPHGTWVLSIDEVRGEPGYSAFGNYIHGAKTGLWYKMDLEGELVAIENYKNDLLDGEVKYYNKGRLFCVGQYRALNPTVKYDSIVVEDPITGLQSLVGVPSDWGTVRHGMWRYYDPITGRLIKEQEYQIDEVIFTQEYTLSKADSAYYEKRAKQLPHKRSGANYKPPADKIHSYTN